MKHSRLDSCLGVMTRLATSKNTASGYPSSVHVLEAIFLDIAMGAMTPKRESKREGFMSTYI